MDNGNKIENRDESEGVRKTEQTLHTMSRKSYNIRPTPLSEMICGLLAAATAVLIWLMSVPM